MTHLQRQLTDQSALWSLELNEEVAPEELTLDNVGDHQCRTGVVAGQTAK